VHTEEAISTLIVRFSLDVPTPDPAATDVDTLDASVSRTAELLVLEAAGATSICSVAASSLLRVEDCSELLQCSTPEDPINYLPNAAWIKRTGESGRSLITKSDSY